MLRIDEREPKKAAGRARPAFAAIGLLLLASLLFRIVLAPVWTGYDTDVQTFMSWSNRAFEQGLSELYVNTENYFIDYPPGYMYVLYVVGWLHHALAVPWGGPVSLLLLKLPPMLADIALSLAVYMAAIRALGGARRTLYAAGLAALYALNPAVWINSAVWGQVDAVFVLFVLGSFWLQQRGKLSGASVLLAAAILLKPQGLLFGPFLLMDVLRSRDWKQLAFSLLWGAAAISVFAFPFALGRGGYGWLFELYFTTLSSYPYASLNAYNLLALLGGNFVELQEKVGLFTYGSIGTILMLGSLVFACYMYLRAKDRPGALFYIGFLFITAIFVLGSKMHERYLYYGLLLALMSFVYIKDKRVLFLFAGFSVTHAVNVGDVLLRSFHQSYHVPRYDGLLLTVSAINVLLFLYACLLGWRLFVKPDAEKNPAPVLPERDPRRSGRWLSLFPPEEDSGQRPAKGRFFSKKDFWLLGGLLLVYSLLALYRLGGHEDPSTYWKPARTGEAVIADLGAKHRITRINSFAGVGEGTYSYWFSLDGKDWFNQTTVKSDHTQVFTWHTIEPGLEARFVRVSTDATGFYLHEVGIFGDQDGSFLPVREVIPVDSYPNAKGEAGFVFDEPETVPYTPTYMEGSYFDEIYHARTAYEHLHQIEPYESTHPPLGKILISFGIWLFGLNPFGWRIVGTVFGILMIPVMYMFAKRMFGKSEYAFMAAFLLTFDFMHFAQTRIATIDVYGVFFIMLMFYFMYRYTTFSFYRDGLWKTLAPLGLSGLFFGIGAASKWIVIYGGAGLALLLLLTLLERYAEYRFAKRMLSEDKSPQAPEAGEEPEAAAEQQPERIEEQQPEQAALEVPEPLAEAERSRLLQVVQRFPKHTLLTLSWCVLMFVAVPLFIYTLSYIPFMMVPGPGHGLKDVVTYQKHIFNYHKNLVATHPFSSPWWEWPLMLRPIWYYQGKLVPEGMLSSIVSFGNPLVWWPGLAAVLFSVYAFFRRRDKKLLVLLVAYCSQYLPWMLVPRLTFIYHYFAMVPFLILLLVYWIRESLQEEPHKRKWVYIYLGGVFVLFLLFYPILSGMLIPERYSMLLRWLPGWSFF